MLSKLKYVAFVIGIFSCNHSDTPNPQSPLQNCQVIEYQLSDMDIFFTQNYLYNEQSKITEVKSSSGDNIERSDDGQIKNIEGLRYKPEFFYDSLGRVKKMVVASTLPSGTGYTYTFYEYDSKGHISQKTWLPWGSDELSALYNPDFKVFVAAAVSKYGSMTNYWEQKRFMELMEYTICTKYLLDESNLTITEIRNMSNGSLANRVEKVWAVTKYDGKISPYKSPEWRPITMYWGESSLNSNNFPELGNILQKTSPFTAYSGDNYIRTYVYNNDGYPESGTYVDSAQKVNVSWKYNCKQILTLLRKLNFKHVFVKLGLTTRFTIF